MPRRDLNVTIDGDSRGFQRAAKEAQRRARDYERELNRINARIAIFAKAGAAIAPPVVTATAAAAAGMGAAASAAGTLAAAGGTVALAMNGLGEALDALNKARLDPTQANLQAVSQALQQLAPAGRNFVFFLDSLQPKLEELQGLAQQGLLPGVEQGLQDAMTLFPQVRTLVDRTSNALGRLAEQGGAALTDPFWTNYIDFLSTQAAPTIQQFGQVIGNLAQGFAGIQMAFGDLQLDMGRGLVRLSEQFATFGAQLSQSQGFHDFVSYVRAVTPQILDTVGAIAQALGAVAEAAAPIGPVALAGIEGLANVLSTIASIPGLGTGLFAFASGLAAVNTAMKAYNLLKASSIVTTIGKTRVGSSKAALALGGFATKLGAVGLAVGVVDAIFSESATELRRFTEEVESAAGANTNLSTRIGLLEAELRRQQGIIDNAALTWEVFGGVISLTSDKASIAGDRSDALRKRIQQLKKQQQLSAGAGRNMAGATDKARESMQQASPRAQVLADKFGITKQQARNAWRQVDRLDSELQAFFDLSFGVQEAQDRVTQGFQQLAQQVKDSNGKLRGNSKAAVANREQLRGITRDVGELMVEEAKHSKSLQEVKNKTQDNIDRFRRYARRIGLNDEAVERYTKALKNARIDVINKFKTPGLDKAKSGVVDIRKKLVELDGTYAVRLEGGGLGPKFKAAGGPIHGPGTATSDSVPAMLSTGEHVWTAREVRGAGGHQAVESLRQRAAGFAAGGPVTAQTIINTRPLSSYVGRRSNYLGGFSAMDLSDPGNVGGVKAFVRDMAASRYGWTGHQWSALHALLMGESGFRPAADNPTSSAHGIFQFLDSTRAAYGIPLTNSPAVQTPAGLAYIADRYGNPGNAYSAWLSRSPHWYDQGGVWPPGTAGINASGKPEAVLTNEQWRAMRTIARAVERVATPSPPRQGRSGEMRVAGGRVEITRSSTGQLEGFVRDLVVQEMGDEAAFQRRRA